MHNVETVYWLRTILEHGGAAFAARGVRGHQGQRYFSVSGRVAHPGLHAPQPARGGAEGHRARRTIHGRAVACPDRSPTGSGCRTSCTAGDMTITTAWTRKPAAATTRHASAP